MSIGDLVPRLTNAAESLSTATSPVRLTEMHTSSAPAIVRGIAFYTEERRYATVDFARRLPRTRDEIMSGAYRSMLPRKGYWGLETVQDASRRHIKEENVPD